MLHGKERILSISNFKNIGIDKKEEFVININCDFGGFIVIIGENNVGKTNV